MGEPNYKYGQQEQETVRKHNRSIALERSVLNYWGLNRFECRFSLDGITTLHTTMTITNRLKITLTPLRPKPIDTFLYQHFKRTGHSPNDVLVQPVEKLTYDKNSSSRFKIIKRHETELKWIKLLQTPFPLGFNDNIYHEGNMSKMLDFDVFSLLEIRKRKSRSHGIRKKGNGKRK